MYGKIVVALAALVFVAILLSRFGGAKPEDVQALLQKGGRIIDVRTAGEFRSGHLSMATNIPLSELKERITRDIPDKDTPLLLHCASGMRSAAGKRVAESLGYRTVVNLGAYSRAVRIVEALKAE